MVVHVAVNNVYCRIDIKYRLNEGSCFYRTTTKSPKGRVRYKYSNIQQFVMNDVHNKYKQDVLFEILKKYIIIFKITASEIV